MSEYAMITDQAPLASHILTYAQSWRGGGVERVQLRLATAWIAAGRRVTLVIGDPNGPLAAEAPDGMEVIALPKPGLRHLAIALPKVVHRLAPDLIFCPGNHYTALAALLRLRLRGACPPIVGKVSNALSRPDQSVPVAWGYRRWLAQHPRFLDAVVAMTPAFAAEAIAAMHLPRDRVHVIANPPAQHIAGGDTPILPSGRFLLGVGRLVPQKRWDRLIDALPDLADRDVALLLLGDGALRGTLEAQVATRSLGHRVTFAGHVADPLPIIARAAAVVLVSDYEGVPGVLREALSLGTPVVTTASSVAIGEIVTSPEFGSVVTAGDAPALVAALDHWLAPGRARPQPVPMPGTHAGAEYLALFDRLVRARAEWSGD